MAIARSSRKSACKAYVASAGVNGALMLYPQEIKNYRDWTTIDVDLWRHYWFAMVNRGVLAQPYWWDEQWTISVQHTEADIDKHLPCSRKSRRPWRKLSKNAAPRRWAQPATSFSSTRSRAAESRSSRSVGTTVDEIVTEPHPRPVEAPHLRRVLGRWDLVLLFVVAVFNLNVVPSIAANGGVTIWLWMISLVLFFWPQGIAVIELAHRFPGEGGVYLWAKEVFGDFHGFLSGWCYWTNNMMYVPTVMLYFVGVSVFALGSGHHALADNKVFALTSSLALLAVLVVLNVVGLGVGKWINNLGAIGTGIAAAVLIGLGVIVCLRFGTNVTVADFQIPANPRFVLNSFGVICFGLVGLELASVMGDEIENPQKILPGAVAWGGVLSGLLYIGATLTLLIAVSKQDISVLQGIVQAVSHMAARVGRNVDRGAVCVFAEFVDCGDRLGMAGGFGAHSVCRGARFLHAGVAGQGSPEICDAVCGANRACRGFDDSRGREFLRRRGSAGNISEALVAGGGAAARAVYLYVRRIAENGRGRCVCARALQPDDFVLRRSQRAGHDDPRNRAGVFSCAADYVGCCVRSVDVWRHAFFCRPRGVFLFRVRPPQSREKGRSRAISVENCAVRMH